MQPSASRRGHHRVRRKLGTVTVLTALILVALIAAAALSVDVGVMLTTRGQLQNAADSAALAAMLSMRDTGTFGAAVSQAESLASQHNAGGDPVQLAPSDVTVGNYDFSTRTFTPGLGFGAPAVQVVTRRGVGSPAGPLPLYFAPVIGRASASVSASAVAASRRRDLVLVQDRTNSFVDEFPSAQAADEALVEAMNAQGFPGDRMALITFARDAIEHAPLTNLTDGGAAQLVSDISQFPLCTSVGGPGGPCYGTDIGIGIDKARSVLDTQSTAGDAERVIVIVSDGTPCFGEYGNQAVAKGQAAATAAANRAGDDGLTIFVVTLDHGDGGGGACQTGNVQFNESLARGFGKGFTTTNESDLDDLLVSIIRHMPVYLVQ